MHWKAGRVTVRIPRKLALGSAHVRVRTHGGELSNPVPLTVEGRHPAPVLLRVKPAAAHRGAKVRILGAHLGNVRKVEFGHHRARILHRQARKLVVRVPRGHGVLQITVVVPGGPSAITTRDIFRYGR